jgi:eRF1 domain 3.
MKIRYIDVITPIIEKIAEVEWAYDSEDVYEKIKINGIYLLLFGLFEQFVNELAQDYASEVYGKIETNQDLDTKILERLLIMEGGNISSDGINKLNKGEFFNEHTISNIIRYKHINEKKKKRNDILFGQVIKEPDFLNKCLLEENMSREENGVSIEMKKRITALDFIAKYSQNIRHVAAHSMHSTIDYEFTILTSCKFFSRIITDLDERYYCLFKRNVKISSEDAENIFDEL